MHMLGKLDPARPDGLLAFSEYAKKPLPTPPAGITTPANKSWGMYLNDTYGDCTIAGGGHDIAAWNLELSVHDRLPTNTKVKTTYFGLTGGDDTGLVEADVLAHWRTHGLFTAADKILGYAPIELGDQLGLRRSVAFLGQAYLGLQLPQSAEDQFANGQPWSVVHDSRIAGGHCVVIVGYDATYAYIVTWGQVVAVEWAFLKKYLDEGWAIVPHQFAEAGHGTSIDIADHYDLAALEAALPQAA